MPLKAPIAFFDNSLSYGSSVDEELIELTANYENEVKLMSPISRLEGSVFGQDADTDDGGEILENDDEIKRIALEEKRKQRRNCKIYQVGDIFIATIYNT